MATSNEQTRNIVLWAVVAIIVLGLIGWWAGWFASAPTPTAETPAPATTTEQSTTGGTTTTTEPAASGTTTTTEPATGSGTTTTTTP